MSEWKNVKCLFDGNRSPEQVCRIRTEYALKWYIKKANHNKRLYYIFSLVGIFCPLLNTVLAVCGTCDCVTVILSSVTTLAASCLALTNARGKWENYRSAAEYLKKEYVLFQAKVPPYESSKRPEIYLKNIESYMMQTHVKWTQMFEDADNSNSGDDKAPV